MFGKKKKKISVGKVVIRGVEIEYYGERLPPISELPQLYLIFKAMEGDELAIEILGAGGRKTKIRDATGSVIYPVENPKTNQKG